MFLAKAFQLAIASAHVQIAAGDGFTMALSPNGSVYGCGCFKDDVGGLSGFTDKVRVQKLMTLLYAPTHPKDEVNWEDNVQILNVAWVKMFQGQSAEPDAAAGCPYPP
eukprot:1161713-Pelagomonas_calceolata.AAC.6